MFYTDDPVRDAERHFARQEHELSKRPVCIHCEEPVQDSRYVEINDEVYCFDCIKTYFTKRVEDYIE